MKELIINGVTIRQDNEGRFSLSDVRRAAIIGGTQRACTPSRFMRKAITNDLVLASHELLGCYPMSVQSLRNGGTFVIETLIYYYALSVSPAFYLTAFRAFEQMKAAPQTLSDVLRHAADVAERNDAELKRNPLEFLQSILDSAKALRHTYGEQSPSYAERA